MNGPAVSRWAFAAFLFASPALVGQEADRAADHEALRALKTRVAEAVSRQDTQALATCMAKSYTFTTINQRRVTTPEQMQAVFHEFFQGPAGFLVSHTTRPEADELTRFLDERTGIATGVSKETYVLKGGKSVDLTVRWTATVVKEGDAWKVAAAHVGVDPLDNPMLAGATGFWKTVALGAGLGGLILGFLAAFLLRRKG